MNYFELKERVQSNLEKIPIINSNNYSRKVLENIDEGLFLYCISRDGKTGEGYINFDLLEKNLKKIGEIYKGKKLIGFAMGNKENILKVKGFSEGIIMGSEMVRNLSEEQLKERKFYKIISSYNKIIKM